MLIDETDTFLKNNDELRGVLNSGHTRATAFVIRCQSEAQLPRSFSTWAAIALAGIGQLPATLADRSIEIKLKRKTLSENAMRLDRNARAALSDWCARLRAGQPTTGTSWAQPSRLSTCLWKASYASC